VQLNHPAARTRMRRVSRKAKWEKRKGRLVHHDGRPFETKAMPEASPAGWLVANHAREPEEEECSSGRLPFRS